MPIEFEDAKIDLPQINERVKTLAAAQSADIAERLRSVGVTLIAGRGELVDDVPGHGAHTVKVTAHDGTVEQDHGRRRADRHRRQPTRAARTQSRTASAS